MNLLLVADVGNIVSPQFLADSTLDLGKIADDYMPHLN